MKAGCGRLLWCAASVIAAFALSCAVGPNYKRPAVDTPDAYRRAASDTNTTSSVHTFADLGWWDVYDDPQLKTYIAEALTNNWDIKIAAARVLEADASLQITRSQFFPTVNAAGNWTTVRSS